MKDLTIRSAGMGDLPALCHMEAACFTDAWSREAIAAHLSAGTSVSLIAECGGEAVGYLFGFCLPPEGELYRIATLPAVRRSGFGRVILQGFLDILEKKEANVCFLEVREGNVAACALYRAFGFLEVGRRRGYYKNPKEDALVMRRESDVSSIN